MTTGRFDRKPVLAVCGWSGSGKTTLLERLIPRLIETGLRVAVVKHDAHGVTIDREGKDSARLFAAGADVCLRSPDEIVFRSARRPGDTLDAAVRTLLASHDLVLVEGHKDTPLPKIWCHGENEREIPETVAAVLESLPFGEGRVETTLPIVERRLDEALRARSLFAGILIGGESRRMGRPKHHLTLEGESLLRRAVTRLETAVDRVVILGNGTLPDDALDIDRLPDAPGTGRGPLAGLATALRWAPGAAWILTACDMPGLSPEALEWLIDRRRPGCWAVIPRDGEGRLEPTLALYEPQAGSLVDAMIDRGRRALRHLGDHPKTDTPGIPRNLLSAWTNVNTPQEFESFNTSRETDL